MTRRGPAALRPVDGILLLDKTAGPSSNQALQHARRLFAARKAGHAGTLDPLATGLLPILFGEATKFGGSLSDADKVYEATVLFGVTTTTGDLAGDVLQRQAAAPALGDVLAAAGRFEGAIDQVPPMHSAVKVGGRPLYVRARRGETIDRVPRTVHVSKLLVQALRGDECDIEVHCSKGTYIRVLAEDMGRVLGCGATLKRLRRTRVDPFAVGAATTLEALESLGMQRRADLLLPMDAALMHLPAVWLEPTHAEGVRRGQSIVIPGLAEAGSVRLYDRHTGRFIGLGDVTGTTLHPRRLLADWDCGAGGAKSLEQPRQAT